MSVANARRWCDVARSRYLSLWSLWPLILRSGHMSPVHHRMTQICLLLLRSVSFSLCLSCSMTCLISYKVCVDRWECVRQVALPQEPVVLAAHGTCLCVATCDRYLLHDYQSQTTLDLFQHNLGKQNIIANKCGKGEFILNGPGNLGKNF